MKKQIHIFGGGTFSHVQPHLALAAPAFGTLARLIDVECKRQSANLQTILHLTRMGNPWSDIITNADLKRSLDEVVENPLTKIVFFTAAVCDFDGFTLERIAPPNRTMVSWEPVEPGKYGQRLDSSKKNYYINLSPADKLVGSIREKRKDIFLVACKTTSGATPEEMYLKGLNLCKTAHVNLVLVNDTRTRYNMIVTPEEAAYHETTERHEVVSNLVEMAILRSHLTFTRSTVVEGKPVPWNDPRVPYNLREVVNHCVAGKAYKPFKGATVGHFATKLSDTEFLTSIRRSDFNKLDETGLVYVKTDGPDTVIAYGAKPSVGGQSQRTVFKDHSGYTNIVHFHSPLRENHPDNIPTVSQREVECGSHQCGQNTSKGLGRFTLADSTGSYVIKAVYLDKHGPNIVFDNETPGDLIVDFIERNFDLSKKTGGYNLQ